MYRQSQENWSKASGELFVLASQICPWGKAKSNLWLRIIWQYFKVELPSYQQHCNLLYMSAPLALSSGYSWKKNKPVNFQEIIQIHPFSSTCTFYPFQ